jgi:hypothetical protein
MSIPKEFINVSGDEKLRGIRPPEIENSPLNPGESDLIKSIDM